MSIRDILESMVRLEGDKDLLAAWSVWSVLDRQLDAARSSLGQRVLDAVEAIDLGDVTMATATLTKSLGGLWPSCPDEGDFCPLCASVQSAMFVDGVAEEVSKVLPHLLLLDDLHVTNAQRLQSAIVQSWMDADGPEYGYTAIFEGPGFLAFVEQV